MDGWIDVGREEGRAGQGGSEEGGREEGREASVDGRWVRRDC